MPAPVSEMRSSAVSPLAEASKRSSPPSGMACMALTTTLSTACLNRSRSTRTSTPSASTRNVTWMLAAAACGRARSTISRTSSCMGTLSNRNSTGRVKSRKVRTTRSRRRISREMISICSPTSVSPWESLARATSTCSRMALSGFFTSWATPLVMRLMAVRRSAVCSSRLIARRVGVAQADQDSAPGAVPAGKAFEYIHRKQQHSGAVERLAGRAEGNAAVAHRAAGLRALRHQQAKRGRGREDAGHQLPQETGAVAPEEFFHRAGGEDEAELAIEDEDRVFQLLQQVVDVAAQVGEFGLRPAQALAEQIDLGGHHRELVGRFLFGGQNFGHILAAGGLIQHLSDVAKRAENGHGEKKRQQDGSGHRDDGYFRFLI